MAWKKRASGKATKEWKTLLIPLSVSADKLTALARDGWFLSSMAPVVLNDVVDGAVVHLCIVACKTTYAKKSEDAE
jgi:hypothetical protein